MLKARRIAGLLLLLAACACRGNSPRAGDAAPPPPPRSAHAPFGELEDDGPPWPPPKDSPEVLARRARLALAARPLDRAFCADEDCCVTGLDELGRDRQGQELLVVRLHGDGQCVARSDPPPQPFGSGLLDRSRRHRGRQADNAENAEKNENADDPAPAAENEGGDQPAGEPTDPDRCHPADYHLVGRKGGRVRDLALLATSCDVEPDFPSPGDTVAVDAKNKILGRTLAGGHAIYETTSVSVGLDPLRLVGIAKTRFDRTASLPDERESWDWDSFSGTATWNIVNRDSDAPKDAQEGDAAAPADAARGEDDDQGAALLIPDVNGPDAFVAGAWRTTRLGSCAADISGGGYTIHGGRETEGDASLRAVVIGRALFVEVTDDRFVGPGRSWVKDDHLELWLETGKLSQWGIRVADGAVFPAYGAPQPLAGVERVIVKQTARFKIPLPAFSGITIVYSDSDDGRHQKWLVGSSQLRFGKSRTLGMTRPVRPEEVTCVVKNGALETRRMPMKPSDSPIVDGVE